MKNIVFFIIILLFITKNANSQIYQCDSLSIKINSKTNFDVFDYKDLNISVTFKNNSNRKIKAYYYFDNYYKSNLGNCYFELYKFDSTSRNVTFDFAGSIAYPKKYMTQHDILLYDTPKSFLKLKGERILTYNILDFISGLNPGDYSMILYVRVTNLFGYNNKGQIEINSVQYISSKTIEFKVRNNVKKPG